MTSSSLPHRVSIVEEAMARLSDTLAGLARESRKERGELVRKFGKMAEDMVAPSIPRIVETLFGVPDERIHNVATRVRRRDDGRSCEVDVLAAWPGGWLVVEAKTDAQPEDVRGLLRKLGHVRDFFPEYADRKLVGALASLDFHPTLARHAERHGLIVVALGDDLMEVRNTKGFVPRVF